MKYYGSTTSEMSPREKRNAALARRAAAESYVLLQNPDNTLPLKAERIALFGMGARRTVIGGEGSGECNPRYKISIEQGLENAGYEVTSKNWLDDYDREYADTYEAYRQMVEEKNCPHQEPDRADPRSTQLQIPLSVRAAGERSRCCRKRHRYSRLRPDAPSR